MFYIICAFFIVLEEKSMILLYFLKQTSYEGMDRVTVGNPVVTTHKRYFWPPPLWQTIWAGEPIALIQQVQTPE